MKYCTEALVNEVRKKNKIKAFFLGDSRRTCYYEARHKTRDIYLLWIEAPHFGKTLCYPCILRMDGVLRAFENGNLEINKQNNDELVTVWEQVVDEQRLKTEYTYNELEKKDFNLVFKTQQKEHVDAEIAKMLDKEMEGMDESEKASFQAELEEGRARDKAAAEERARKAAEKEARKNRKNKEEDIAPENLEEIQDETLRSALQEAREQAKKEEEQGE
ncbi:MAG: hypothetical protein IKK61_00585 [Clostridia bacterium]|nr:hypothetical protein [Clostridia bacterium]